MKRHDNAEKKAKRRSLRAALLGKGEERHRRTSSEREEQLLNELFRPHVDDDLEKVESFVAVRDARFSDLGLGIGVGPILDSEIRPVSQPEFGTMHAHKSNTKLAAIADDARSVVSVHSLSAVPSQKKIRSRRGAVLHKGRKSDAEGSTSTKPQLYAGLTHSDLDIQNSRPPLMYQMNVLEWLWLQSSTFHRVMIMFLALLFCVFLANIVFAIVLFADTDRADTKNPYLCSTTACRNMGKRILKTMNESVDPCDNFYAFVCGTDGLTPGIPPEEEEKWNFGSARGRIKYNYHSSISIGRLLRKKQQFPASLLLPFYKGCLDRVSRNEKGLEHFYENLRHIGLYSVDKSVDYNLSSVITTIADILTHSIKTAAILHDHYYMDENNDLRMYVSQSVPAAYKSGGVLSYGYEKYKNTIIKSFTFLSELNIPSSDLEIIAHDIICIELFIKDRVSSKVTPGENILTIMDRERSITGKACPKETDADSTIPGNFGRPKVGTRFDYEMLVDELYEHASGGDTDNPIKGDPSTDKHTDKEFVRELDVLINQSSGQRLLRYLQFRVFYELAYDLNDDAIDAIIDIRRHHYTSVPACVQHLFSWMPFVTPEVFMHSFAGQTVLQVEQEFSKLLDLVRTTYYKLIARNKFKEYENYLGRQLEPRELRLLREIVAASMRTDDVSPVSFEDRYFPDYEKLYHGMKFDEDDHFNNLMNMGLRLQKWRLAKPYRDIFYSIHSRYHVAVWMDKIQTHYERSTHRHVIYLPMASAEVPYFHDGLLVSDFGGAAWVFAGAIESAATRAISGDESIEGMIHYLMDPLHRNLHNAEGYTPDEIREMIKSLKEFVKVHFVDGMYRQDYNNGWMVDGERWELRYSDTINSALRTLYSDQKRYHVLSLLMDDFLGRKENWKHRKAVLKGLEKYNAKQLFYISLVGRRCDRIGKNKRDHIKIFGPINYIIRANKALSNLDHFAKTFKCPVGSKMNLDPSQKLYFWDRDIDISNFMYNESEIGFLQID